MCIYIIITYNIILYIIRHINAIIFKLFYYSIFIPTVSIFVDYLKYLSCKLKKKVKQHLKTMR